MLKEKIGKLLMSLICVICFVFVNVSAEQNKKGEVEKTQKTDSEKQKDQEDNKNNKSTRKRNRRSKNRNQVENKEDNGEMRASIGPRLIADRPINRI